MLTDEEVAGITERHYDRKQFREAIPPGLWLYDSFAFLENSSDLVRGVRVRRDDRVCILIRRRAWVDALMKVCGDDILDEATFARNDDKDLQPAEVGQYFEKMMDVSAEQDIETLLKEVRRLRGQSSP
jgi:hypothetical protein